MTPQITAIEAAVASGIKTFAISGASAVVTLFGSGIPVSTPHIMIIAVVIAFLAGGIKGIEKAYNYQP